MSRRFKSRPFSSCSYFCCSFWHYMLAGLLKPPLTHNVNITAPSDHPKPNMLLSCASILICESGGLLQRQHGKMAKKKPQKYIFCLSREEVCRFKRAWKLKYQSNKLSGNKDERSHQQISTSLASRFTLFTQSTEQKAISFMYIFLLHLGNLRFHYFDGPKYFFEYCALYDWL